MTTTHLKTYTTLLVADQVLESDTFPRDKGNQDLNNLTMMVETDVPAVIELYYLFTFGGTEYLDSSYVVNGNILQTLPFYKTAYIKADYFKIKYINGVIGQGVFNFVLQRKTIDQNLYTLQYPLRVDDRIGNLYQNRTGRRFSSMLPAYTSFATGAVRNVLALWNPAASKVNAILFNCELFCEDTAGVGIQVKADLISSSTEVTGTAVDSIIYNIVLEGIDSYSKTIRAIAGGSVTLGEVYKNALISTWNFENKIKLLDHKSHIIIPPGRAVVVRAETSATTNFMCNFDWYEELTTQL